MKIQSMKGYKRNIYTGGVVIKINNKTELAKCVGFIEELVAINDFHYGYDEEVVYSHAVELYDGTILAADADTWECHEPENYNLVLGYYLDGVPADFRHIERNFEDDPTNPADYGFIPVESDKLPF